MTTLFFLISTLYSMVGFGGGSSYIALMVLMEFPYEVLPSIALICNLIVVAGGAYHFLRQGHLKWSLLWPFVVTSVPLAFLGGRIPISKEVFLLLLGISLLIAGLRMILSEHVDFLRLKERKFSLFWAMITGGAIGLLSGFVGIGGGIFLSPLIINLGWARPKQVAAVASCFIFVNSLSGLIGQTLKHAGAVEVWTYWPLFLAVFLGGQIGSRLGSGVISQIWVLRLTALLVLFVGGRVLF